MAANAVRKLALQSKREDMSQQWAEEVMAMSRLVDDLIQRLPDISTAEREELTGVLQAMTENEEAGEVLRKETAKTSELLAEVRGMHAVLADAELRQRHRTKAT